MQNKKQGVLTGWSKVFLFTIKQEIKGKNFLLATLGGFFSLLCYCLWSLYHFGLPGSKGRKGQ